SMIAEVQAGRGSPSGAIFYDLRGMDPEAAEQYVQIASALRRRGITAREAVIEVFPAQHSLMGGVRIDHSAGTTLGRLFAAGETAGGTHGAHRRAAAGGFEAGTGGALAGESAARYALDHRPPAQRVDASALQPRDFTPYESPFL